MLNKKFTLAGRPVGRPISDDDFDYKDLPEKMQPNVKKVNLDVKNVILDNETISNKEYMI